MTADEPVPASDPTGYQAALLARLGDRDPEAVQAATPGELRRLVAEAGPWLRQRPAPGEWSVLELVGHITDAELVVGGRYRWIIAEDRPRIMPYDQDLWAAALQHNEAEPAELIESFAAMRAANLALWRRSSAATRARHGLHQERGPESYDLTFRMLAGHDLFHVEQARQTLDAVRGHGATGGEAR
jgi:hypothetical protein